MLAAGLGGCAPSWNVSVRETVRVRSEEWEMAKMAMLELSRRRDEQQQRSSEQRLAKFQRCNQK